jgi:translocation and assembly module TamB
MTIRPFPRLIFRFLRAFLATILVVLLLITAIVAYLGFTASGNQFLANRIAEQVSTPDMQVTIQGAKGLLQGRFQLERVTLSDTKGQFAEIGDLQIAWTPSELLRARFHADKISAGSIAFERTPVATIESEPSDSSFALPIEVKVDALDLPSIALGQTIVGRQTTLAVNGSAQAITDRITLDLTTQEKTRPDAIAKAKLAYSVNARTLMLDGSVSEPQGGMLARLLALPGLPPVEIAVRGDGPLDDWNGSVKGRVAGAEILTLSGGHRLAEPGIHQITLTGGGRLVELMPPALRTLFAGETAVDIDTRIGEDGLLQINAGSIENDSLVLKANGLLDPKGDARLEADLTPKSETIRLELPLASGALTTNITSAHLAMSGQFRSAQITLDAALASLTTPDMQGQTLTASAQSSKFDLASRTGLLALAVKAGDLKFKDPNVGKIVQGPLELRGNVDLAANAITLTDGEIQSAKLGGRLSGDFKPAENAAAAQFSLHLLPQGLLPSVIEAKIKDTISLSGELRASLPSAVSVKNLKLTSNLLAATGSAGFDGTNVTANIKGNIADLAAFDDKIAGGALFTLDASGPLAKPNVTAEITSPEVNLAGNALQKLGLKLTSAIDPDKPGGKLSATAIYRGQTINAELDALLDNGQVSIPALKADIGVNKLTGALTFNDAFLPSGKIGFNLPDLPQLAALAGQKAEGELNGSVDLASENGKIAASIRAAGPRLAFGPAEIIDPHIDIKIADLLAQQLSGKITANRVKSGANQIEQVTLDLARAGGKTAFTLKSRFDAAPLLAQGRLDEKTDGLTLTLSSFSAAPRKIPLKLVDPTEIAVSNGQARLSNLTIAAGDGSVILNGTAGETLDLTARIADLPIALANAFSPGLNAAGMLSADATITGKAAAPIVSFETKLHNLETRQTRDASLPALDIAAKGRFAGNVLTLDADSALRDQPVKAHVEARLNDGALSLPNVKLDIGASNVSAALTLDAQFLPSGKIDFDIPDAGALAAIAGRKAEGTVKGKIDLASANGKITAKLDADGLLRGQTIKANLEAVSENGAISVPALKADIGRNTLSGTLALDAQFQPSGQIAFDFPDMALLAALAGQKAEGAIKGTADISSNEGKLDVKVAATGAIRGQNIDLAAEAVTERGAVSLPSLRATIGPNTLTGQVTLDSGFMPSGEFSFDLPDVGLLAALAGQQAEGALKGSASLQSTDGKISGTISANGNTLRSAGAVIAKPVIDLTIDDLASGRLSGRVTADQIASGANRLDALALNVELAGTQTRFDLTSQFDGAPLTANGNIEQKDGSLALTLSSFSAVPRKIPVKLAKPSQILIKDGAAHFTDLVVNAGDGTVTINGTAGKGMDLRAVVAALPASLANTFTANLDAAGAISANVHVTGEAASPVVDFDTDLQGIETSQTRNANLPALTFAAKGRFANNTLSLDATGSLRDQPTKITAETKLENGTVALPAFAVTVGKNALSGNLALDQQFQPSGRIDFDIAEAGALAAILGQKAEGSLKGSADVTSAADKIGVKIDADGSLRGQAIKTATTINLENGAISLPALKLDVGKNTLTGAISLDKQFMPNGKLAFDFPDVALLAALAGQKAEGAVNGTADVVSAAGKISAKIAATGKIRGQAIDVNAEAISEKGLVSLPTVKLDVGKNTLTGAIALDKQFMPSGKVNFDFPDIGLLAAFAGQKADGALKGAADIKSDAGKLSGKISASGQKVSAAGTEIGKPMIDLTIADLTTGQLSGKVTADTIVSGANRLSDLALTFDRAGNETQFDLKSRYDGAPMTAKGAVEQQAEGIIVSLSSFSAAPKKIPVKLNKPTRFEIRNGAVALTDLAISAGKGSITVNGTVGKALDITAKINALPASIANTFASGLDAAGTISANVIVKGDSASPTVAFDTNWQNAATSQTRAAGLTGFNITAKGQLAKNVLSINADARGGGLSLNANGTIGIAGSRTLGIKVKGQLPFAALATQLAAQGIDLRGDARFDLSISGAATNPSISGRVTTDGATLTVIRQNLTIKNLAASVELTGKQARIASLTGALAGGGTVSVSGTVGITPNSGFPADLKIALKNAVYTDGRVVAAKLSGDLGISGSLVRSPVLNGRIRMTRADITIPEKLPGALSQLNVKHKNAPRDVAVQSKEIKANRPSKKSSKNTGGIALDLTISAPRQIFVRGRGLDAELGGEVKVAGTSSSPNVSGGFKMRRGRLSIIGRRLDFTSGTISFGGDMMPALNLIATSTVNTTTINVTVSGLANDPAVTFGSSPALPQDEVLALLIFGRSSASLSAVQIAQLADAVSTLAGGQSNSLFNRLRQGLGVDDLDVGTDENGQSNVSAGKYLNKRTYLQFQQGVDNSTSKAAVNLDIGKGLKLRGEAGTDGSTATGIFFEKEY